MLTHLSIRDVVLIERLDIEFERGLCVLTGETGAGKSIVLDALGLALGGRADLNLIRAKSDKLSVSASFLLPAKHAAIDALSEQDISFEDNSIVVRRVLSRDGRGKAFINDQPVSISLLREVAAGQSFRIGCLLERRAESCRHESRFDYQRYQDARRYKRQANRVRRPKFGIRLPLPSQLPQGQANGP